MNSRLNLQMFAQTTIVMGCLLFLIFQFSTNSSRARTSCWPNDPPLGNPSNPQSQAWPQYQFVQVLIFDRTDAKPTSQADFDAIDFGIRDWNTVRFSGCSNVTHGAAVRANRAWAAD